MTTGRTLDRSRLERLMADEMAAFERANPRSRELFERAKGSLLDGVPMNWMIKWAGPVPAVRGRGVRRALHGRRRPRVRGLLPRRHRGDGRPRPGGHDPRRRAPAPPRHHAHAPDRGRDHRRRRAPAPVRAALLAVHAHGDGREPVRHPARPPHHRPVEDPRPQPLLPRVRGRDVRGHRARRRGGRAAREHRQAGAARGDHPGRGDQRPRRPGAGAGQGRRRGLPVRAGADQRRHRAARARLPRGGPGADPAPRHPADQRRDAHDLRGPRRLHGRSTAWSRTSSRSARRSAAGSRPRPTGSRRRSPSGSARRSSARTATWAASAGPSPGTPSRWRPSGRR